MRSSIDLDIHHSKVFSSYQRSTTSCKEKEFEAKNSCAGSMRTESELNEFKPRLKVAKNRFQLSAGLNLEILNTILSGTNHI